jgi:hypothetical protein
MRPDLRTAGPKAGVDAGTTEAPRPPEEEFRDGLLWVGRSYRHIHCGEAECLEAVRQGDLARCFAHEAEWRGISRKIPAVPPWVLPRKTRIFLVYRGTGSEVERASIFGYFVLARIEVLDRFAHPDGVSSPDLKARPWSGSGETGLLTVTVYESHGGGQVMGASVRADRGDTSPVDATTELTRQGEHYQLELPPGHYTVEASHPGGCRPTTCDGIEILAGKRKRLDLYLEPREPEQHGERWEQCSNGSKVMTHRWINDHWQATGERCRTPPDKPECSDDAFAWDRCPDGTVYLAKICRDGKWVSTGFRCPSRSKPHDGGNSVTRVPIDVELFADHRSCSLRLRPSAIYLVDSLCAEITDAFADLAKSTILDKYRRSSSESERQEQVDAGRASFRKLVEEIRQRRASVTAIPKELEEKAERYGELVLFHQPATFVKRPRAAFRSLQRIDGDDLLEQIAKSSVCPVVRFQGQSGSEIAAWLAPRFPVTLRTVEDLLGKLAELVREELQKGRDFGLLGLVRLRPAQGTTGAGQDAGSTLSLTQDEIIDKLTQRATQPSAFDGDMKQLIADLSTHAQKVLTEGGTFRLPRIGTMSQRETELHFRVAPSLRPYYAKFEAL